MTRCVAAFLLILLAWPGGAVVARPAPLVLQDVVPDLPIPPIPPDQPPDEDTAAPVPGADPSTFASRPATSNTPGLQPDIFTQKSYGGADGYLSGSGQQEEQSRKQTPPAGFRLNVPLQ